MWQKKSEFALYFSLFYTIWQDLKKANLENDKRRAFNKYVGPKFIPDYRVISINFRKYINWNGREAYGH